MLTNLLHNAVKFSKERGQISVRTSNPEEGRLQIEVADSGIGIEPEVLRGCSARSSRGRRPSAGIMADWAWAWRSVRGLWICTEGCSRR